MDWIIIIACTKKISTIFKKYGQYRIYFRLANLDLCQQIQNIFLEFHLSPLHPIKVCVTLSNSYSTMKHKIHFINFKMHFKSIISYQMFQSKNIKGFQHETLKLSKIFYSTLIGCFQFLNVPIKQEGFGVVWLSVISFFPNLHLVLMKLRIFSNQSNFPIFCEVLIFVYNVAQFHHTNTTEMQCIHNFLFPTSQDYSQCIQELQHKQIFSAK